MRFTSSVTAALTLVAAVAAQSPTVEIDAGTIVGTTTVLPTATAAVNKYLGIPFAQSPPERFSPPVTPAPFTNVINATQFSAACIQQFVYPKAAQQFAELVFNSPAPQESEDCLYLNVFQPDAPAAGNGRAVLFWIYGGGLEFGNAGQAGYDGSRFAAYEDVIVVSTNYRTNVFGFPSSPELADNEHNLGFLDQRLALDWVQRNIQAFGGDPKKVTIFGESAGAFSVDALLTSFPLGTYPPFRGAILESGQYSYRTPTTSSVPAWNNLTEALGCPGNYSSNLTCVRAADATTIKNIIETNILEFDPQPDNVTLVQDPRQARKDGNIARVPVMGGTNAQEGRVFTVGTTNATTYLTGLLGSNQTDLVSSILAAYPVGPVDQVTQYDIAAQIFTEFFFQCPQAAWANDSAAVGIPTWRYYFNASFPNTQMYPDLGVYHSSEIGLVFRSYQFLQANTTTQQNALAEFMQGAWAKFAKNPAGGPGWNAVGTGVAGNVLSGANSSVPGGIFSDAAGQPEPGTFDLGVLGNVGNVQGGGVTVVSQAEVDYRCALFAPIFAATG